jgi:uncharacterized membrane protein
MEKIKQKSRDTLEQIAIRATRWIGSTNSILVHTTIFIIAFVLYFFGIAIDKILLVLTTIVSLEAIYLSIFIQMSVNRQARKLHAVARDVDEIQEDVEDIQEDVEEIEKDVDEIQKDVDEIQEDVEDIQEEDEADEKDEIKEDETLDRIEKTLGVLISEIAELKKEKK